MYAYFRMQQTTEARSCRFCFLPIVIIIPWELISIFIMFSVSQAKLATVLIDKYIEEVEVFSEGSFSVVCDCVGCLPSLLSLSHCWQTGFPPWQPCWAGFQPSSINLWFPPMWLHFEFPQGATLHTKVQLFDPLPHIGGGGGGGYKLSNKDRQGWWEQLQDTIQRWTRCCHNWTE